MATSVKDRIGRETEKFVERIAEMLAEEAKREAAGRIWQALNATHAQGVQVRVSDPELVRQWVASHPGQALSEIANGLGVSRQSAQHHLHELRRRGAIKAVGQRASTRYHAA